ncbi:hypothetical protein [Reichenbachiella ulvae]|uniref:STAS/SEC14 domain-containing protein n=1 Tax=Reichenbachiella ulvae TaxID=2980104 RepID=A0ABT3CWD3_9BACT|nr:hypothetical protein [Reichenbachiella ulvae]MCV9387780.1 hypothetical protein [Reichenbachiella ulvae]
MEYSKRIHLLTHKGKKIYYFDFSGLRADEHPWIMDLAFELAIKQEEKTLRYISNVANTRLNIESKNKAKAFYAKLAGLGFQIKAATIGLTAWQRLIVSTIDRKMFFSNDLEKAKEYLVNEDSPNVAG